MTKEINEYLKEARLKLSRWTYPQTEYRLNAFKAWLENHPSQLFSRPLVVEFLTDYRKAHPASMCAQMETVLKAFATYLVGRGLIGDNFLKGPKIIHYRANQRGEDFGFTKKDYARLKAVTGPENERRTARRAEWYGAIIVGWHTGLRLSDVCNLAWESIDLEGLRISLKPQKTRKINKHVDIPILPELEEYLRSRWGPKIGSPYLFPHLRSSYDENGHRDASRDFRILCRLAGIEGKSFHSFRHSMASRMLNNGMPLSMIAKVTGHTLDVLQRYSHVSFDDVTEEMKKRMIA